MRMGVSELQPLLHGIHVPVLQFVLLSVLHGLLVSVLQSVLLRVLPAELEFVPV